MKKRLVIFSLIIILCALSLGLTTYGLYRTVYEKQQPIVIKTDASILYYEKYIDEIKNEYSYGFYYLDKSESGQMIAKSENIKNDLFIVEDGYILATDFNHANYEVKLGDKKIDFLAQNMVSDPYINKIIKNKLPFKLNSFSLKQAMLAYVDIGGEEHNLPTTPKPLSVKLISDANRINVLENFYLLPFFAKGIFYDASGVGVDIIKQKEFEIRTPRHLANITDTESDGSAAKFTYEKLSFKQSANKIFCGTEKSDRRTYYRDGLIYCEIYGTNFVGRTFNGEYFGNNNYIQNVTLNANAFGNGGLFFANRGAIKNLNLKNISVKSLNFSAGLVGTNYGSIEDCTLIASQSEKLEIISGGDYCGGITSVNYGTVKNCNIINNSTMDNTSKGIISIEGADYVGGIVGFNKEESTNALRAVVENCQVVSLISNGVFVKGKSAVGGISGISESAQFLNNTLKTGSENSKYYINVEGKGNYIGGLLGSYTYGQMVTSNGAFIGSGKILVKGITDPSFQTEVGSTVGGYIGKSLGNMTINCQSAPLYYNLEVSGQNNIGGFIGYQEESAYNLLTFNANASNLAQISGTTVVRGNNNVGGFIGSNYSPIGVYDNRIQFDGWIDVAGTHNVGGAVGSIDGEKTDIFNFNLGSNSSSIFVKANGTTDSIAGGFVGRNNAKVATTAGCDIKGNITVEGGNQVGGVIGLNAGEFGCIYNPKTIIEGKFIVKGQSYVGGVVGANFTEGLMLNIVFKPTFGSLVEGVNPRNSRVGGFVGNNLGLIGDYAKDFSNTYPCSLEGELTVQGTSTTGGLIGCNDVSGENRGKIINTTLTGVGSGITIKSNKALNAVVDSSIGGAQTGGIAGLNNGDIGGNVYLETCTVNGKISIIGSERVGGVAGENVLGATIGNVNVVGSNLIEIKADVTLGATNESGTRVGGIVGYNNGVLGGDHANTKLSISGDVRIQGGENIGGIAGINNAFISNCVLDGESATRKIAIEIVSYSGYDFIYKYVGGIAGTNYGQIGVEFQANSCWVKDFVEISSNNGTNIGGITGVNSDSGWILNATVGSINDYSVHINGGGAYLLTSTLLSSTNNGRVGVTGVSNQGFVGYAKLTTNNASITNPNQTYTLSNK